MSVGGDETVFYGNVLTLVKKRLESLTISAGGRIFSGRTGFVIEDKKPGRVGSDGKDLTVYLNLRRKKCEANFVSEVP